MSTERDMLQNKNAVHLRCALGLAMQNFLYIAGMQWSRVYLRRAQEKADARVVNKSTPTLPRVFVSHRASVSFGWASPSRRADSGTIQHRRAPRKYATGR
ncbi:hypothetical protein B0H16DRAFT_1731278 [Mycena metata]|uniref:Uncharacterized protein n=1 Tax=Mycena metata TaxID=1033252 RepID=A0AAD7I6Q0_9AGAR|nr:hypothetical protein B0H16DRAFT_1731278 [Mycena metata]